MCVLWDSMHVTALLVYLIAQVTVSGKLEGSSDGAPDQEGLWATRTHADERVPLAWVRFLATHAAITRELDAEMHAKHGLTISDYEVLLFLSWEPEGRLRRSDLAERVLLTQGGVTRLLTGLEDQGLVTSAVSKTDRRVTYAELTPKGRRKLKRAAHDHTADIERLFTNHLSPAQLHNLAELLHRLPGAKARAAVDDT